MNDKMTVLVVDGNRIPCPDKLLIGTTLCHIVPDLAYMSPSALAEVLYETFELIEEIGAKGTGINKIKKSTDRFVERYEEAETDYHREEAHKGFIYFMINIILASEGLGTLHGFGFCKFDLADGRRKVSANLMINPEKTSIYK